MQAKSAIPALDTYSSPPCDTPWLWGHTVRQAKRRMTERHVHENGQVFVVESGVMAIMTQNAYWLVGPGQVLWLPSGLVHEARSHGAITGWSLYITKDRSATLAQTPFLADSSRLLTAQVERLLHHTEETPWNAAIMRLADCFWDELLSIPRQSVSLPFPKDHRLKRVAEALSATPADSRTQQAWADMAGMSLRSFIRYFTDETGLQFSVWRQRLRLLNAQEKLARGERVTEVAASVGYDSMGAFAAAFKKSTGYTPSAYAHHCRIRAQN